VFENKDDMNKLEEWYNEPLPISAEDAWKVMEQLLNEDVSDKIPVPIPLTLIKEKNNVKPYIIVWYILLLFFY
jgi:hypothetical protein